MFLNFEEAGFSINLATTFLFEKTEQDEQGNEIPGLVFVSMAGMPKLVKFPSAEVRDNVFETVVGMLQGARKEPQSSIILARPGASGPVQRR